MCKCNPEVDVEYCWKGECKSGWGGPMVENRSVLLREENQHCQHQWFRVKDINNCEECKCEKTRQPHIHLSTSYGTLVQCANCGDTKELWG